ncbi:MAG TPA: UDP-N-acetylmuramate dehydrogenase [Ilumatobacter sp.]|nr:UDP-N-acetylmuramate dehydrogenase [Ilumatobacter sp.]
MTGREQIERAGELLASRLGRRLQRDVALAPMTTYRVGGPAALFVDAAELADLAAIAEARAATGVPVLVVGRGSNMLVADTGFAGVAVSVAQLAGDITIDPASPVVVAGGGVALPVAARRTAAAGLTGFEWAVGVPGSIGGAVRMNAGGHGSDMAACLVDVDVFDLAAGSAELTTLPVAALGLRFRASSLAPAHVVIRARLALATGDRGRSEAEIADIVRWRREHQPGGQNCGSVFVNPVPGAVTAGALIDSLGLRGTRFGTAWVSEKHANFIQAGEGGTAADVRRTIEAVRAQVADATGYHLRSEVRLVGFDDTDPLSFEEHAA